MLSSEVSSVIVVLVLDRQVVRGTCARGLAAATCRSAGASRCCILFCDNIHPVCGPATAPVRLPATLQQRRLPRLPGVRASSARLRLPPILWGARLKAGRPACRRPEVGGPRSRHRALRIAAAQEQGRRVVCIGHVITVPASYRGLRASELRHPLGDRVSIVHPEIDFELVLVLVFELHAQPVVLAYQERLQVRLVDPLEPAGKAGGCKRGRLFCSLRVAEH